MDVERSLPPPRLERLPAIVARTGMSKSWLYREISRGNFPRPLEIGRARCWDARAVDQWIETQLGRGTAR